MILTRRYWLGYISAPAILLLLLWLPFGFQLHGLLEEWGVLSVFGREGPVLFVKAQTLLEAHRLRPLTVFPHAIGYLLDRDSFNGWHWVLIATLLLKTACCAFLGAVATRSPRWGAFFGLLVLLYPADTMQLSFRSQHINLSLAMVLLGSALLVRAYLQGKGWVRWITIAGGAASLLAAQMMYEVALMLVVVPPFILWCRDGAAAALRSLRSQRAPTLGWIAPALLYVLYVAFASASGASSYQQTITDPHSPFSVLLQALPKLFNVGLVRALAGGWYDAWGMTLGEFQSHAYLLAVGTFSAVCLLAFPRNEEAAPLRAAAEAPRQGNMHARVAISGLVLLALGYVPYLFSPSHVHISQRTFLFASFGAALAMLALVMVVARWSSALVCVVVLLLMTTGAAAQLYQFHHYVNLSEAQRKLLRTIVENFDPADQGDKTLIIQDYSNQLSHVWFLRDNLDTALSYFYDRQVPIPVICLMPTNSLARIDELERQGRCVEGADDWTLKPAGPLPNWQGQHREDEVLSKAKAFKLVIDKDGVVQSDKSLDAYRERLASADTPAARRYRHILLPLGRQGSLGLFKPTEAGPDYRWNFGKWWSLEMPIRGDGWRAAVWKMGYFHHDTATWKSQERASLLFELVPTDKPYQLVGNFDSFANPNIESSIRIQANGVELQLVWQTENGFSAQIPAGVLKTGTNTIEFFSAIDKNYYDLSARLDELEVVPVE